MVVSGLPAWLRLYVYGLHGLLIEICFTAGWEFALSWSWKLPGVSSVWAMGIYGLSGLVMERIYAKSSRAGVPILLRGLLYVIWVYAWEYSTGLLLSKMGACPWDYSGYTTYNVHGLITFEYAPAWYCVSILMEVLVIRQLSRLQWSNDPARSRNKLN